MFVKKLCWLVLFYLNIEIGYAQLTESFSDGDFSYQPEWITGNENDWLVNDSKELQSNNLNTNSFFRISTRNERAMDTEWNIKVKINFNPSSTNYIDIYLTASHEDLTQSFLTGYFIRIGNTEDDISLYRKDSGNVIKKLIDGRNGILNNSINNIELKVIRDKSGKWYLFYKVNTANQFISDGTAIEMTYISSSWFGILVRQSTSSFFQRHFFDDVGIKQFVPDTKAPLLLNGYYTTDTALNLVYDEVPDGIINYPLSSFEINYGIGSPERIIVYENEVRLSFKKPFTAGTNYTLNMPAIEDTWGNKQPADSFHFTYYAPSVHDILITEIMADPTPHINLPDAEWIEIKNCSKRIISLYGWQISDYGGRSKPFTKQLLHPDSSLILTGTTVEKQMQNFGRCLGVEDFPSLNNDADELKLTNEKGQLIHVVSFDESWYKNVIKAEGGWTLEMKDTRNPCGEETNWTASIHPSGGTPGKLNSVTTDNPDNESPYLIRAFATDSLSVRLYFSESIDSASAANTENYIIEGLPLKPVFALPEAPSFKQVILKLPYLLDKAKNYQVSAQNLTDCSGNTIGNFNIATFGLTETCEKEDVIINEILFDPKGSGSDYVELFNRSSKRVNLKTLIIANRTASGNIGDRIICSTDDYLLNPNEYVAICNDRQDIIFNFPAHKKEALFERTPLPSFTNDKGTVILINKEGVIIDEVSYTDDWHFPLISSKEGVALERIKPDAPTQQKDNWTSAAQDIGFGTPGMQNSQYRNDIQVKGAVTIQPEIFSPDQDGNDDFLTIHYSFQENGYVMNSKVFDAGGRVVRHLQRNLICGLTGSFRWDGLDNKNQQLPTGPYLIFTEVFHLKGKVKRYTNRVIMVIK